MSRYVKSTHNSGTLLLTRPQVCGGIIIRIGLHHLGTHLFTPTMKFAGKLLGLLNLDLGKVFVLPYIPGEIEQLNGSILKIFEEFIIHHPELHLQGFASRGYCNAENASKLDHDPFSYPLPVG